MSLELAVMFTSLDGFMGKNLIKIRVCRLFCIRALVAYTMNFYVSLNITCTITCINSINFLQCKMNKMSGYNSMICFAIKP